MLGVRGNSAELFTAAGIDRQSRIELEEKTWDFQRSTYRLYMSETMSISASAAAIFCSEESWGRPPKRKDILCDLVLRFQMEIE
jgi:hypothetical protein